ncbi:MAG: ROK family transcriptional regulator [Thermomicrobiales bacterium]
MRERAYSNSRAAIISLLLDQGELSRVDIARATGLSRAAISLSVGELVEEGLVQEVGTSRSTGGRRPVLLRLGGEAKLAAGVAFEEGECILTLVNLDGQEVNRLHLPDVTAWEPAQVVETIANALPTLLDGRPLRSLLGCGLALSGQVNSLTDTFSSVTWRFHDTPLRRMIEERVGVPATVLDNAHAAGLGELWLRGRETREHLVYFYMGMGTGGAIVTGRDLYVGRNHAAGEIGATIIDPNGPDFGCHRGCLEGFIAYTNLRAIIAQQRAVGIATDLPAVLDAAEFVDILDRAAGAGDPVALGTLRYAARYVGIEAANMINLLNPDEIILGGAFGRWGERFASMVSDEAAATALPASFAAVRILPGNAITTTIPLGAAATIIHQAPTLLAPTARDRAQLGPAAK